MREAKITLAEIELIDESLVVSRVLVRLHKAIDEHFPSTFDATDQFKKTIFSEESTETGKMPSANPQSELQAHLAETKEREAPQALERRNSRKSKKIKFEEADEEKDKSGFYETESGMRKPFDHSIENKADLVSLFAVLCAILAILGVLGFSYFLLF